MKSSVFFSKDIIGIEVNKKKETLKLGEVLLIENIRFHNEEKPPENIEEYEKNNLFAKELAQHMDFFINEAFSCSHRSNTSMVLLPKHFPNKKLAGLLLEKEIKHLTKIKNNPSKPFTSIIGGAKISSKIKLIEKLLIICDNIIVGGAMAHTFILALKGKIGSSFYEPNQLSEAKKILEKAKEYNCKIYLPVDCITTKEMIRGAPTNIRKITNIPHNEMGVDIGPESLDLFKDIINISKTILWNGPMGVFEIPSYSTGTKKIAQYIHATTKLGAYSIIGGGDSVSAINSFNQNFAFSYLSTGGGAMLEFFETDTLPGIVALTD